jgi:hypothetical protein
MPLAGNWQINLKKLFLNFNIQNSNEFSRANKTTHITRNGTL